MSATIHWFDDSYNKLTYLSHGDSLTALSQLVSGLQPYTTAGIDRISVTLVDELSIDQQSGDFGVTHFAKVLMRDDETNELYGLIIPAPRLSMFEEIAGRPGWYVKQADGVALTALYASFSGRALTFHEGALNSGGRYQ